MTDHSLSIIELSLWESDLKVFNASQTNKNYLTKLHNIIVNTDGISTILLSSCQLPIYYVHG